MNAFHPSLPKHENAIHLSWILLRVGIEVTAQTEISFSHKITVCSLEAGLQSGNALVIHVMHFQMSFNIERGSVTQLSIVDARN